MKEKLITVALNETSYNVNLLHKALSALSRPVDKEEAAENRAGSSTLKQVRSLQTILNVPVDESTLVNEITSVAIVEALTKAGLTKTSHSFTVTCTARLANGEAKKRQWLLAFDLDLRGIAVYRTVGDLL
jgi:hypothetical protein